MVDLVPPRNGSAQGPHTRGNVTARPSLLRLTLALVMLGLGCLLVGYVLARFLGRVSPAGDYLWRAPTWVERGGAW